jgi:hypothetical protein
MENDMPPVKKTKSVEREVVYPEKKAEWYIGDRALDVDTAKDLLGWQVEEEGVKFGDTFDLKDYTGRKVRLINNTHNRELDQQWVKELVQNHLRKQFKLNGESVIIGKYGSTLSAQHRLVSLILAEQQRDAQQSKNQMWDHTWGNNPVTMETVVVYGVDEDPETVRTIDNVKPKSLADVLYADPELFSTNKTLTQADRSTLTKMLESAVRKVRFRTHADKDAYRPKRTHAEEAVKHIFDENKAIVEKTKVKTTDDNREPVEKEEKKTTIPLQTLKLNPGSAAGLLYLMATSGDDTDGDKYRNLYQNGNVDLAMKKVKFTRWDSACQFWSLVCDVKTTPPPLKEMRYALSALNSPTGESGGTTAEREAIVIKAWNAWINDEDLNPDRLSLDYSEPDAEGNRSLINHPDVGGIDFGVPVPEVKVKSEKVEGDSSDETGEGSEGSESDNDSGMTEQEIEERKEAERLRKELATAEGKTGGPRKKKPVAVQ